MSYYILFVVLWIFAYMNFVGKSNKYMIASFSIVAVFVALRFETGNDWPSYLNLFEATPTLLSFSMSEVFQISSEYRKELVFVFYNVLLKSFIQNLQIILIISTAILIIVQYKFFTHFSRAPVAVFVASVSWLLFSLYISAISQSLALSFFLLFSLYVAKGKLYQAVLCALFSVFFQVSAAMYFAIYFISRSPSSPKIMLIIWIVAGVNLLINFGVGSDPASFIISYAISVAPGFVQEKLTYYYLERGLVASNLDFLFVAGFTFLVGGWLIYERSSIMKKAPAWIYNYVMYFVVFQSIFINYAVFRYRVLYLAFSLLFILIFNRYYSVSKNTKTAIIVGLATVSLTYSILFLNRPTSINFVPYQNALLLPLTGTTSDGADRYSEMLRQVIRR